MIRPASPRAEKERSKSKYQTVKINDQVEIKDQVKIKDQRPLHLHARFVLHLLLLGQRRRVGGDGLQWSNCSLVSFCFLTTRRYRWVPQCKLLYAPAKYTSKLTGIADIGCLSHFSAVNKSSSLADFLMGDGFSAVRMRGKGRVGSWKSIPFLPFTPLTTCCPSIPFWPHFEGQPELRVRLFAFFLASRPLPRWPIIQKAHSSFANRISDHLDWLLSILVGQVKANDLLSRPLFAFLVGDSLSD